MYRKSLLLFIASMLYVSHATAATVRQRLTFDQNWQFKLCRDSVDLIQTLQSFGINDNPLKAAHSKTTVTKVTDDTEPEQAQVTASEVVNVNPGNSSAYSQSSFRTVQVPHDWSAELPFDPKMGGSAGYLAGGQGVYVKEFTLPASVSTSKRVRLQFDGVYHRATVWVNGHRAGYHVYGYTGFGYDITPYLNKAGKNRVVVHVNREEQSRWYTGSGIYRHVWLDITSPTHIKADGVFVTTGSDGTVNVSVDIDTAAVDRGKSFKIANTILNAAGKRLRKPLRDGTRSARISTLS